MKNFVVIGLGNFGFNIVQNLAKKGKNVLAIDSDPEKVNNVKYIASDAVVGDAKQIEFLREFIDTSVDAIIISTGLNKFDSILAVHHLNMMGIKNIIVKAVDDTHAQILKIMGAAEIVFPEKDIADWWANKLADPNLIEHLPLASDYSIVEFACPDGFTGKSLKDLQLRTKYKVLLIAVKDILKDEFLLMPEANYKLKPDTILLLMGKKSDIRRMKLKP